MTRAAILVACAAMAVLTMPPVSADSPITSTHFCEAYLDYPIVVDAQKSGVVTKDIARYLTDDNPIDVKAAVINALSWDTDGKDNAARYGKLRYRDTGKPPDVKDMDGHEAFVLGYLTVMDDYFHPDAALPYMDRARELLPESYTVAMVRALVMAQAQMDKDDWGPLWESVSAVMENEELNGDMRVGAVKIITDYMALYAEDVADEGAGPTPAPGSEEGPRETFRWEMEEARKYQTADGVVETRIGIEFLDRELAKGPDHGRLQDALIEAFGDVHGKPEPNDELRERLRVALEGAFGEGTVSRVSFLDLLYQAL